MNMLQEDRVKIIWAETIVGLSRKAAASFGGFLPVLFLLLLVFTDNGRAQNEYITSQDGNWNNSAIWSPTGIPNYTNDDSADIFNNVSVTDAEGAGVIFIDSNTLTVTSSGTLQAGEIQIRNPGVLSIQSGATITSNLAALAAFDGSKIILGNGINLNPASYFLLSGAATVEVDSGTATISGNIQPYSAGAHSLTKTGTATLILSGANSYDGGTTISGGILETSGNNSAFGTGTVAVQSGGELYLNDAVTLSNDITISGTGASSNSGAIYTDGNLTNQNITGTVTLAGDALVINGGNNSGLYLHDINLGDSTLTVGNGSGVYELYGNITGTGDLVINTTSVGVLLQGGTNTFTGTTVVSASTEVILDHTGTAIPGDLVLENGATAIDSVGGQLGANTVLIMNGTSSYIISVNTAVPSETIAGLSSTSTSSTYKLNTIDPTLSLMGSLTLDGTGNYSFAGQVKDALGGTLSLIKTGSGTQTLTGTNTYHGDTVVSQGTLVVSGTSGAINHTFYIYVGQNNGDNANMVVSGGATVTGSDAYIGYGSGATGNLTVTGTGSSLNTVLQSGAGDLYVGYSGSGTMTISNGGTVNNLSGFVGGQPHSTGSVTVTGTGSTWNNNAQLYLGYDGSGSLMISSGGTVTATSNIILGSNASGTGNITVTGTGSSLTTGNPIIVGASGSGTVTVSNGGSVSDFNSNIGYQSGAKGSVTVDGAGSKWTNSGTVSVGTNGTGTLTISNGGSESDVDGIIARSGGVGSVTVTGTGSTWTNSGNLTVGGTGTASLTITNGGTVTDVTSVIGQQAGSTGSVTVTGTGSTWNNTSNLLVGDYGAGSLTISDGATVTVYNVANLGASSTGTGTVTVTGSGSSFSIGRIAVGGSGLGVLNISNGGTVSITTLVELGIDGGTGTITVDGPGSTLNTGSNVFQMGISGTGILAITNGGTLETRQGTIGVEGLGIATVTGTGSLWDNNGSFLTIGEGFSGVGNNATGTLTISNGGVVSTGATELTSVAGDQAEIDLEAGGTLKTGSITTGSGTATLNFDGGTLTATGDTTDFISSSVNTTLESGGGTIDNGGYNITINDALTGTGSLTFNGSGTTTLTTTNTNTGDVTVNGGTMALSGTSAAIDASGQETLYVQQNGAVTITGGAQLLGYGGYIGNNGTAGSVTVSGTGSLLGMSTSVYVGQNGGLSNLTVSNGGEVESYSGYVENGSTATVTTGGTWTTTQSLAVGNLGSSGTLVISADGHVSDSAAGFIGDAGGTGTVLVTGTGSTWNIADTLYVAYGNFVGSGTATITITAGGLVSDNTAYIAKTYGDMGTVTVSGTGSTWNNSGTLYVGESGAGALTISGSGTVSSEGALIGDQTGSTGSVTVTGTGSTWNTGNYDVSVGNSGSGTLTISNGGKVSSNGGEIGYYSSGTGSVTVDGAGSTWNNGTGDLLVGDNGTGTLTVSNGGTVDSGQAYIGDMGGSNGTVTVDGTGSSWVDSSNLYVGYSGTGGLTISNGGQVSSQSVDIGDTGKGVVTVTGSGSSFTTHGGFYVGTSGTGTLLVSNGGTVSGTNVTIGSNASDTGSVSVDGPGSTLHTDSTLYVGDDGNGSLTITNGGTVTSTSTAYLANFTNSTGSVTVDGSGSNWTISGSLIVANSGTATMTISNGGAVSDGDGNIGYASGSTGSVTVTGTGSSWANSGVTTVGGSGTASLTITNGGTVTDTNGMIGQQKGSTGNVTVTGTGSVWNNSINLYVGNSGTATLSISGGARVTDEYGDISNDSQSVGSVTVTGTGSTWSNSINLYVGFGGSGTLTIANGGTVMDGNGYISISTSGTGSVTVTGTGSTWNNTGLLYVGNYDTGTLTVSDGGTVTAGKTNLSVFSTGQGTVNLDSGGVLATGQVTAGGGTMGAFLNFDGGTLQATATGTNFISSGVSIALQGGGGTVDNNGYDITINASISGTGGVTFTGTATTTLTATSTYSGSTTIAKGILETDSSNAVGTGTVTVDAGATLQINGDVNLANNVTISGTGTTGQGAIFSLGSDFAQVSGTVTLAADASVGNNNGVDTSQLTLGAIQLGTHTLSAVRGDVDFNGDITGTGGLIVATGVLIEGGNNTFTGPTDVLSGGDLRLADSSGTAIPGNLIIEDGGQVFESQGSQLSSNTVVTLSGSGQFTFEGVITSSFEAIAGLTGTSGSSLIHAQRLPVPNHSPFAITLTLMGTDTYSYAGQITDTPAEGPYAAFSLALIKMGTGTQILSGDNTYQGGTTINAGTLEVGSATALGVGDVTLNGGTLTTTESGTGIQLNIGGNYTQTGGTLKLNLYSASNFDSLNLTSGKASVGGTLDINIAGDFAPGQGESFNLISTGTTVTGTFSSVLTNLPSLGGTINYSDNVALIYQKAFIGLGIPLTPNQTSVATYIDTYDQTITNPDFGALVGALNTASSGTTALQNALNELLPLNFANFASSNAFNNASFLTSQFDSYFANHRGADGGFASSEGGIDYSGLTINDPNIDPALQSTRSRLLAWSPAPNLGLLSDSSSLVDGGVDAKDIVAPTGASNPWNIFITGNVVLAQDFSDNQAGLPYNSSTTAATEIGADYKLTPHLLVGAAFGYGHTHADLDTIGSSATVNTYSPAVYMSYANGGWYYNALASYGFTNYSQNRNVNIGAFTGTASSAPGGDQIIGNLDGGYNFHQGPWTFGPTLGLQYVHLTVDGYSETGLPGADLTVAQNNADSLRSRLGGTVNYTIKTASLIFTPHLSASWQHEFMDQSRGITSQFNAIGAGSFVVNTPNPSRDSALVDVGLDAQINNTITVFTDYSAQAGQSNYFGQSVQAGVKIGF